jgi:hypothetical protein
MRVEELAVELDRTRILCSRFAGETTDREYANWLDNYRRLLITESGQQRRVLHIVDLSHAGRGLNVHQRRIQSDWNKQTAPLLRATMIGLSFVAPSMTMRGVLTAVFWVSPPPVPYAVCVSMEQALAFCFKACEENGIRVTEILKRDAARLFYDEKPGASLS